MSAVLAAEPLFFARHSKRRSGQAAAAASEEIVPDASRAEERARRKRGRPSEQAKVQEQTGQKRAKVKSTAASAAAADPIDLTVSAPDASDSAEEERVPVRGRGRHSQASAAGASSSAASAAPAAVAAASSSSSLARELRVRRPVMYAPPPVFAVIVPATTSDGANGKRKGKKHGSSSSSSDSDSSRERSPRKRPPRELTLKERLALAAAEEAAAAAKVRAMLNSRRRLEDGSSDAAAAADSAASRVLKTVGYDIDGTSGKKMKAYKVEAIRSRRFNRDLLQYQYELKWEGFPEEENTWECAKDTMCPALIRQYHIDDEEKLTLDVDLAVEKAHRDPPPVAFHRDGLCILTRPSQTLRAHEVIAAEEKVRALYTAYRRNIRNRDLEDVLESKGFDNFKLRDRGRYDMTLDPVDFPFLANPPWLDVVRQCLGGKPPKLQHAGCMMSLPNSAIQPWHSDGPHKSKDTHLPAHLLNVFVPLVDMTRRLGGTQFQPGSHVHHDFNIRTTSITPLIKAGQALLFDYRIRHRGLANEDVQARPLLYFTYSAAEHIVDDGNFSRGRYKPLPPLSATLDETREQRLMKRQKQRGEDTEEAKEESKDGTAMDESDESASGEDDHRPQAASSAAAAAAAAVSPSSIASLRGEHKSARNPRPSRALLEARADAEEEEAHRGERKSKPKPRTKFTGSKMSTGGSVAAGRSRRAPSEVELD